MTKTGLKKFFLPEFNRRYLWRLFLVALTAFVLFRYICIPFRIKGDSMAPTYRDGGVNFCYTLPYLVSSPERFDVVAIRLAGHHVMLLKRIVAVEHDTVAFCEGQLLVNRKPVDEPYVAGPCDWNLPPRTVKPGHVYVVGDNRSIPADRHQFGQTPVNRIVGEPLW